LPVTQNIDTNESNPMARFLLHIMAAFAELEREMIRERVVAGVKAARANGSGWGGRRAYSGATRLYGCAAKARRGGRSRRSCRCR
jgi:DNA invertase Pin-like site-specific DNA recombinase